MALYPTSIEELKGWSQKTFLLSAILSFLPTIIFYFISINSLDSNAGMAGLAIYFILPFVYLNSVTVLNTILYALSLIMTGILLPSKFSEFKYINSLAFLFLLIAFFLSLFLLIKPFFIFIVVWPSLIYTFLTLYYSKVSLYFANVSNNRFAKISFVISILLIVSVYPTTLLLQNLLRYNYQKIDSISQKHGALKLINRRIEDNCKVVSVYTAAQSNIPKSSDFNYSYVLNNKPDITSFDFEYLNKVMAGVSLSNDIKDENSSNIKEIIKQTSINKNLPYVFTYYQVNGEKMIFGSTKATDLVYLINIFDSNNNIFDDYVLTISYSKYICNFYGYSDSILREYKI